MPFRFVRVNELYIEAIALACNEQKLVARRDLMLHDCDRQRREKMLIDSPLERPRAKVRGKAFP